MGLWPVGEREPRRLPGAEVRGMLRRRRMRHQAVEVIMNRTGMSREQARDALRRGRVIP